MSEEIALVGIDCATQPSNVGLALGVWRLGSLEIRELGNKEHSPQETITHWLTSWGGPSLLALDAPLGWPELLRQGLANHRAGEKLVGVREKLFSRATDLFIKQTLDKKPLDVGADRIARTAHAALELLGELRVLLGTPIPLAWSKDSIGKVGAIEVYPAATLIAYGCRAIGYKKPVNVPERREIVDFLASLMKLPKHLERMEQNADTLDAVVCLLAAQDFLEGRGLPPTDQRLAEREGWIWIRSPIGTSHV